MCNLATKQPSTNVVSKFFCPWVQVFSEKIWENGQTCTAVSMNIVLK